MRKHDHDASPEESRPNPSLRTEDGEMLASRALRAGKPGVLDTGAVMHLQRAAGNANVAAFLGGERSEGEEEAAEASPVKGVIGGGGGAPLDTETRGFMESRLGQDFGDVRVHTDDKASESARAVNAHAYTVGHNVVFQRGRYEPETDAGRRMLAHELTHVVQQRQGPVDGTPQPGGIQVSHPDDPFEREAESVADRVMSTPAPESEPTSTAAEPAVAAAPVSTDAPVQRQAAEEEEEPAEAQAAAEPATEQAAAEGGPAEEAPAQEDAAAAASAASDPAALAEKGDEEEESVAGG